MTSMMMIMTVNKYDTYDDDDDDLYSSLLLYDHDHDSVGI